VRTNLAVAGEGLVVDALDRLVTFEQAPRI
jgi:hypothetical protein